METELKSRDRVRDLGEVFTPSHIVDKMVDLISDSDWADPKSIALEPSCGTGNFVEAVIRKKIASGLSLEEAINTTFGMDIMPDNIMECRIRIFGICQEFGKTDEELKYCLCLIINNIFVVKDSVEFIQSKKFDSVKFFDNDPTEYTPKKFLRFIKSEETEKQVLTEAKRKTIKKEAEKFFNKMKVRKGLMLWNTDQVLVKKSRQFLMPQLSNA
jgi:hypothetical protein